MFYPRRSCFGTSFTFLRNAHVHAAAECNYYKTLGLSPSASQAEIKAAYYELSKKHHPDRNPGSEESAEKFRLVRAAYEVLGNGKRRMEYDKECKMSRLSRMDSGPDYKDAEERAYYQSRTRPPFRKYSYEKTAYYDFGAWFDGHYGRDRDRIRQFTASYHEKATVNDTKTEEKVKSLIIFLFYAVFVMCTLRIPEVNKKRKV